MDLTPITTPLIQFAGAVLAGATPVLVGYAIAAFEKRTKIQLTAQQTATMQAAETTAVGIVQAELAAGNVKLADVNVKSPVVAKAVAYLDQTVPEAMRFFGLSPDVMAQQVVGKLGAALGADPTVPTVPVAAAPAVTEAAKAA